MANSARERLAALLADVTVPGGFSARRTAPVDDLHLVVRGLGPLQLPVPAGQARRLCDLARPARYGRGKRTLLDPRVRDTWEIPKSRVKIDQRRWNQTLLPILDQLRADLGVPDGCSLRAELHSMLVYEPGQFFLPHQDSEKDDDMVATLVVTLPSAARGGSLVVEHAGETKSYGGSPRLLSFVAFYADCRHEVRPSTSGYRVVLTYNLLLRGNSTAAAASGPSAPGVVNALADRLDEHFATVRTPTTRLVYLLDHAYTARSLGWARLKGSDADRAAALRAAAQRVDCVAALALAQVHESWSTAESDWDPPGWRRRGDWWEDEPDDDEEDADGAATTEDHELGELLDSDITLDRWIDDRPEASAEAIASTVGDDEVCATTPSVNLPPTASEYEGYMGNYGNTMDRWYRRAAVVVWPRRHDFAVRSEASPRWALDTLATHLRDGDPARARELAATLTGFWAGAVRSSARGNDTGAPDSELLTKALEVAHGLDQPRLATQLLTPFRVETVVAAHAPALASLGECYGKRCTAGLFAAWFGQRSPWSPGDRSGWVASLGVLSAALRDAGRPGSMVARLLLDSSWQWLADTIQGRCLIVQPSRREQELGELAAPIAAVLTGVAAIGDAELRDRAVAFLCASGDALLPCLVQVQQATTMLPAVARAEAGLEILAQHCIERLQARLRQPPRRHDDWSIDAPAGCDCELCRTLAAFLNDSARRDLDWPLAEQRRRHVHARIDAHELPVQHRTRRQGRPYTLVLTKTTGLFEREADIRRRDQADLSWLREHTPSAR